MISTDELYLLKNKIPEPKYILIDKVITLFNDYNYMPYIDELVHILDIVYTSNELNEDDLDNMFLLHLYRIGTFIGISFSKESSIYDRYAILELIHLLPNIDKNIKQELDEILNTDLDNISKLEMIHKNVSEHDIDLFMSIETLDDSLLEGLTKLFDVDTFSTDDIQHTIKINKKVAILNKLNIVVPVPLYNYITNQENNHVISTTTILFSDFLDSTDTKMMINFIISILVISDLDDKSYRDAYLAYIVTMLPPAILLTIEETIDTYFDKLEEM